MQMGKYEDVQMCNYCEVRIIAELVYAADEPADRSKYPTGMSDSEMPRSTADSRYKCCQMVYAEGPKNLTNCLSF